MSESFSTFLETYGDSYPPELTYSEGKDIEEWQAAFMEKLVALRGPVLDRVEPNVEILETTEEADHTRYLLRFEVNACSKMAAYLLIPHGMQEGEKRPGLLVSHGHGKRGIDDTCGVRDAKGDISNNTAGDDPRRATGLLAVQSGYVVLAPAWWGWAKRDGHKGMVGNRDKCNVIQMAASMYGLNVLSLHIQDAQAALDILSSRPEVDASRLGCAGNSYGGRTAMWISIFDDRIKACVSSGSMNTFRERSLKLSSCGIQYLHGLLRYGDVPELYSLLAPRPLQLQAGSNDALITPADRDLILEKVKHAYGARKADEALNYVLHDEGHILLWNPAHKFFQKHL